MIGALSGKILRKIPTQVLVDVGGVGYEVEITMNTYTALPNVGEMVKLSTHLLIREDAHILFGFIEEAERMAFRQLIKVNGLGPKTAISVLSTFSVAQLTHAVNSRDEKALTRVPGIGGKTAERLLIELRDKFTTLITDAPSSQSSYSQINDALISLGYKNNEISKILRELPEGVTLEEGIRLALKGISQK